MRLVSGLRRIGAVQAGAPALDWAILPAALAGLAVALISHAVPGPAAAETPHLASQ